MKRNNKKALYESIMSSVAREVKRALNENNIDDKDFIKNNFKELLSSVRGIGNDKLNNHIVSHYAHCVDEPEHYVALIDAIGQMIDDANAGLSKLCDFIEENKEDFLKSIKTNSSTKIYLHQYNQSVKSIKNNLNRFNNIMSELKKIN